jgi:hypothetical protein
MENQVEQLKLNVTNIKSILINSNAKLKKINSQKSSIVRTEAQKEKKAAAEKNIESVKIPGSGIIGGVVGKIKGIATSFFDKILNFAGYVLLGFIVTKLPEIIETGKKVYNFVKPIWDGVASTIKVIIKGAGFIVGGFQKAFSIFNPSKEGTKIESMKKEIDKLDGELDVDDVPEESVVTPAAQKDTSGSTSAPAPISPAAPVSSGPVELPVIPFQKRNKGGSITKTTQPNQEPWKYDESAIVKVNNLRNYPKVANRFTNNLLFFRKNISDFEKLMKSGALVLRGPGSGDAPPGPGGPTGPTSTLVPKGGLKGLTDADWQELAYIVSAEAGPGDDKYGVAACVLNRVANPRWPNSIAAVGRQAGQFEAVYTGKAYYSQALADDLKNNQGKIVDALTKLNGRDAFKGTTMYQYMGAGDIRFDNRGNFFHYGNQIGRNDPPPANPDQNWKQWIGAEGGMGGKDRYDFSSVRTTRLVSREVKELQSMGKKKKTIIIPYEVKKIVVI